jgi:hypothetical protein
MISNYPVPIVTISKTKQSEREDWTMDFITSFYMPVEKRDVLCYGVVWLARVIYRFPDLFFLPSLQL